MDTRRLVELTGRELDAAVAEEVMDVFVMRADEGYFDE